MTHLNLVPDVVRDTAKAVDVELAIILGILAHHVANIEEGLLISLKVILLVVLPFLSIIAIGTSSLVKYYHSMSRF